MDVATFRILTRCALLVTIAFTTGIDGDAEQISEMVRELLELHHSRCRLIFFNLTPHMELISSFNRWKNNGVVILSGTSSNNSYQMLWGDNSTTCRMLLLHLNNNDTITNSTLRLLEDNGLWKLPDAEVLILGLKSEVEAVLLHRCFRNTIHATYFGLHSEMLEAPTSIQTFRSTKVSTKKSSNSSTKKVMIYHRCMYCNNGQPAIQQAQSLDVRGQLDNLQGYKFKVVTVSYFPYIDYVNHHNEPGTTVTLKDSIDARLIHSFANKLNFTFEIREEPKRSWGLERNGIFSGMMGQLQREEVDFCTEAAPTPERLIAIEYARGYPSDIMVITSLKPSLLPQHLALVRPFSGEVWGGLMVSVVIWSITLWMLQLVWIWRMGGSSIQFNAAFLYSWGALLEQSIPDPSSNNFGKMLVGWWLVFCLIFTTGFRSSLIAHLTVQGSSPPLETLDIMVMQDDWKWGTEERLYKGAVIEYFVKHTDPVIRQVHDGLEVLGATDALEKVRSGGYSFICFRNYIYVIVASLYTDTRGYSPFFVSNKGISVLANLGWGFRKGAPFYSLFMNLLNHMEEAGLTSYWTKDVVARRIKENRAIYNQSSQDTSNVDLSDGRIEVALRLKHLQGAYYLLFMGSVIAFMTLMIENFSQFSS